MRFYLGTHEERWLSRVTVPLFISRNRLARRTQLPRATAPWALDSGGFTEVTQHGGWRIDAKQYAEQVRRYAYEVGNLEWAAPQDWMCEEVALKATGLSIRRHQLLTVENYLDLREIAPEIRWVPVLQGWTLNDYLVCAQRYERAGVSLVDEPLVGLGSVCRRQHTTTTEEIVRALADMGLRLHGFGVKVTGLKAYAPFLASADSMAWSFRARRHYNEMKAEGRPGQLGDGCTHAACNNCLDWALDWRRKVLSHLPH